MKQMFGKEKKPMREEEQKAKLGVLHELRSQAMNMMKDGISNAKGLKKVTVASDSEAGLKEGLKKAEDIVEDKIGEHDSEDKENSEQELFGGEDTPEEEASESLSEEEIEQKIQELMDMKNKMRK